MERRKLKFTEVFKGYLLILFNLMLCAFNVFILSGNSFSGESFITLISNNILLIWAIILILVIFINIIMFILQLSKYIEIVKKDNKNFDVKRNFKIRSITNKASSYIFLIFFTIFTINLISVDAGEVRATSKDNLPLILEDFNVDIQETRECEVSYSSSYFAKYSTYYDSTYEENYKEVYDEETNSYYNEITEENSAYLNYSVFESKYDKIINKALKSILEEYDKYGHDYKRINNTQEVKNWGAKEVYINSFFNEKIIIYDYVIIKINGDIDYNKENIELIKSKILKEIAPIR